MANVLAVLLAFFKALPILKTFWDGLVAAYIAREVSKMKKENVEAIRKAVDEHDQREIEKLLGSPKAGLPSGIPGTEQRDSLPNVL